ncbi:MAG: hypothetical protein EOP10_10490 [Proteobacteria bacterium]|nr:MAG: hypothetical protein EOP10_10490 [Pseudomonadota bacterium]
MKNIISIPLLLLIATGCGVKTNSSTVKEAPDFQSPIGGTGYEGSREYTAIADVGFVQTARTPWTDTYWPLRQRGLSKRWSPIRGTSASKVGFADFLETHLAETSKARINPLLSPAEKYDAIYRWRFGKTLGHDQIQSLINASRAIEESEMTATTVSAKRSEMAKLSEAISASAELADYFPITRDGWMEWTNKNAYQSPEGEANSYQYLDTLGGEEWDWMGLCHGWARAALQAEAPKHSVKVKMDDQELLVSEGDIRGMLTYAWANYPSNESSFVGRRCEKDTGNPSSRGPIDAQGKSTYGSVKLLKSDTEVGFDFKAEEFVKDSDKSWIHGSLGYTDEAGNWISLNTYNVRVVRARLNDASKKTLFVIEHYFGNGSYSDSKYWVADNLDHAKKFVLEGKKEGIIEPDFLDIHGCGDVNAAVFHTTILKHLKEEKNGFVMDRTQTGQVWNQPVRSADVKVGALVEVETFHFIYPGFKDRVAPGTKFVATVSSNMMWTGEPAAPSLDYTENYDDQHGRNELALRYTLEFDGNKELIGGEWGTPSSTSSGGLIPDFVLTDKKDTKPHNSLANGFDYDGIIGQIHACSLKTQADGEEIVKGQTLTFVNCEIKKFAQ